MDDFAAFHQGRGDGIVGVGASTALGHDGHGGGVANGAGDADVDGDEAAGGCVVGDEEDVLVESGDGGSAAGIELSGDGAAADEDLDVIGEISYGGRVAIGAVDGARTGEPQCS